MIMPNPSPRPKLWHSPCPLLYDKLILKPLSDYVRRVLISLHLSSAVLPFISQVLPKIHPRVSLPNSQPLLFIFSVRIKNMCMINRNLYNSWDRGKCLLQPWILRQNILPGICRNSINIYWFNKTMNEQLAF